MKRKILILGVSLLLAGVSCMLTIKTLKAKAYQEPIHVDGQLSDTTQQIFAKLRQQISTLHEANTFAQKNLLRKAGTERWNKQEETPVHKDIQENRSALIADLQRLGMIDEIKPEKRHYTYAAILGALKERFEYRLEYLQQLINEGYEFDYVVLLGGQRPLQPIEKETLPENITTELEMMVYIFNKSALKDMKAIVVDAPMIQKADGTVARPITDDTIYYFAEIAPEDGTVLMISNNPYVVRQTKVAQRILDKKRFPVDGAGKKADAQEIDAIMLMDEFARTLYEEYRQFSAPAA